MVSKYFLKEFSGFSIWLTQPALQQIRSHVWIKYVEEDTMMQLADVIPESTGPETGAPFTTRPDWGQIRTDQAVKNLATVPAGLYDSGYPNAGSDTETWDWTSEVKDGYVPVNNGYKAKVWVLDTGILFSHQEFFASSTDQRSRVTTIVNFAPDNPLNGDCNGHGTHCAGNAGGLYRGIASGVELGSVRVLNCLGSGATADIVAGINYIVDNEASGKTNILSASIGGGASQALDDAINNAATKGVVAVVAAGGSGSNACNYSPARAANAICVGATQASDAKASSSNQGSCVAVFAPGQSIHGPYIGSTSSYQTISGTTSSTAIVAGAIAVYATMQTNQPVLYENVKAAINQTALKGIVTGIDSATPNFFIYDRW